MKNRVTNKVKCTYLKNNFNLFINMKYTKSIVIGGQFQHIRPRTEKLEEMIILFPVEI